MDEQSQNTNISAQEVVVDQAAEQAVEQPEVAAEQQEASPEQVAAQETEQKFASKFAALSRREKQVRDRERQLAQQMSQLEQRIAEMEQEKQSAEKYKSLPDRISKKPLDVLKEHGISMEKLTEMLMNDGEVSPETRLSEAEQRFQAKLEELENKLAEKEAKEQESKLEQQLQAFIGQLTDFVNNTEDYDLIRANDAVDLVYEVIENHHAETGVILSNKEACDAVEEHLLEEAKKLVDRDKVKKLFGATAPATKSPGKPTQTLSNTQASQVPTKGKQVLSDEESKAQAAQLIKWME